MFRNAFLGFTTLMVLAALSAIFAVAVSAQITEEKDNCEKHPSQAPPKFEIARKSRIALEPALTLFVSISPAASDRVHLIALSCELGRKYASEDRLFVWIFDSRRAAKRYNPQGEGNDSLTAQAFLGLYGFSRKNGDGNQALEWRPDRQNPKRMIHIDLGPAPRTDRPEFLVH